MVENLAEIRYTSEPNTQEIPPELVAVASGKGGVGKTMSSFGMAWFLAKVGYRVVVVDMDFGVGNLHLSAGMGRVEKSLDEFFHGKTDDLGELLIPLEDNPKLSILSAGGRQSSVTRFQEDRKSDLFKHLMRLDTDIVLLDVGAGCSQDNIDYFLAADHRIAVATADLSAMTALITFLKKAQLHHIVRAVSAIHPQLAALEDEEFTRVSDLYNRFGKELDEDVSRSLVQQALKTFKPAVLLNRVNNEDLAQIQRVNKNLMRHLDKTTTILGTIPEDEAITRCRRRGQNFLVHAAESNVAKALAAITSKWHESYCSEAIDKKREALQ